jgi:hypothetical protein
VVNGDEPAIMSLDMKKYSGVIKTPASIGPAV